MAKTSHAPPAKKPDPNYPWWIARVLIALVILLNIWWMYLNMLKSLVGAFGPRSGYLLSFLVVLMILGVLGRLLWDFAVFVWFGAYITPGPAGYWYPTATPVTDDNTRKLLGEKSKIAALVMAGIGGFIAFHLLSYGLHWFLAGAVAHAGGWSHHRLIDADSGPTKKVGAAIAWIAITGFGLMVTIDWLRIHPVLQQSWVVYVIVFILIGLGFRFVFKSSKGSGGHGGGGHGGGH